MTSWPVTNQGSPPAEARAPGVRPAAVHVEAAADAVQRDLAEVTDPGRELLVDEIEAGEVHPG